MEYSFEKFEKKNIRQEKRITLTKSSQIGFPTRFCEDNNVKSFKYIVLFFDKTKKAIAIHFTNNENEENKFKIIHYKKYGSSVIARSFFNEYSIDPKLYHGRYDYKKINQEGIGELFVFDLTINEKNLKQDFERSQS